MDDVKLKLGNLDIQLPPTLHELKAVRREIKNVLKAMEKDELKFGSARKEFQTSLIEMHEKGGVALCEKAVKIIQRGKAMAQVWHNCTKA